MADMSDALTLTLRAVADFIRSLQGTCALSVLGPDTDSEDDGG